MAMTSMYLQTYVRDSNVRRRVIQQAFPDYTDWTWGNFWIVFAGQEVNMEGADGTTQSWGKDMIHIIAEPCPAFN